jgi:hypothetical protein
MKISDYLIKPDTQRGPDSPVVLPSMVISSRGRSDAACVTLTE